MRCIMITLDDFVVLKKLIVGPPAVTPVQVKAAYTIETADGRQDTYDLIYSYDSPCFDKKNAVDVNLASMMLAQVALNYGLFFETIEFDGLFEKKDQRFLSDMMENTSREILTNKLLIDNEFIKASHKPLRPEKQNRYTRARILFTNTRYDHLRTAKATWETHPDRYAILSSGGKDSLLTYGIIKEIGEPYPVFINESGRHWFTAVNAFRHFNDTEKNTHKPWCNSDRLFNWMLRHLSFIREDYAGIRADIYPIRLWTVAVFLFGVLPVARKKGAGNILIGNEYDTTIRETRSGISHYCGLYDQSKYFDNAMTRYFRDKGWRIRQYSILRSLSELLIMKILVNRYPELQQHQVSCHAAHKDGDKMKPCGRCEKCRRIIGMLRALDGEPERCGYTASQVSKGLEALEKQSVKQIGSDAAHLYHLLVSRQLIRKTPLTTRMARPHPEITWLRFDRERSHLADLPVHIRKPLFNILSRYADGAVKRSRSKWEPIELTDTDLTDTPYRLEDS